MDERREWGPELEAGACLALSWTRAGERHSERFHSLGDLALKAARLERDGVAAWSVEGWRGEPMAGQRVLRLGREILAKLASGWTLMDGWYFGSVAGYDRRVAPVTGVGRRRGGRYHRRLGNQGAKRWAQAIAAEGEPKPRASQRAGNLPDSWDDYARCNQKCWKKQHRGSKAWDR